MQVRWAVVSPHGTAMSSSSVCKCCYCMRCLSCRSSGPGRNLLCRLAGTAGACYVHQQGIARRSRPDAGTSTAASAGAGPANVAMCYLHEPLCSATAEPAANHYVPTWTRMLSVTCVLTSRCSVRRKRNLDESRLLPEPKTLLTWNPDSFQAM